MNSDDFEKRVQRPVLRQIPPEWRQEILQAARAADRPAPDMPKPSLLSTLNSQLSTFLWPHPRMWAGLAATWVVILCFTWPPGGFTSDAGKDSDATGNPHGDAGAEMVDGSIK